MHFIYDEAAATRRTGRPLTACEIACATSHALVMHEEMEFCGPEGVFILEDDCVPLPEVGANGIPTDWLWRDLAVQGTFAMFVPSVVKHDGGATYIGNKHREVEREYIE